MKEFYFKNRNAITIALNVMILLLGILAKDVKYIIIGILLMGLTAYVFKKEKQMEEEKAKLKAERKAELREKHGKSKKKKKKKR